MIVLRAGHSYSAGARGAVPFDATMAVTAGGRGAVFHLDGNIDPPAPPAVLHLLDIVARRAEDGLAP